MLFLTTLASLALTFTGLANASPIEARQAPGRFYLQTQIIPGVNDCGSNKQALYLESYHTGAGQGAATASASLPDDSWFYLNGTQLLWTYTNNTIGPWPVVIESGPYQSFSEVSISIATDLESSGFVLNGTILQAGPAWQGWLACDWWYTAPSIFALSSYYNTPIPTACSKVNLIAIPAA